jgi:hypothetical protein
MRKRFSLKVYSWGFLALASVSFFACATPTVLTRPGHEVKILTALNAQEASGLQEVSVVECFVPDQALAFDEGCKNELRNSAAARGGSFLVIESRDQIFCVDSISTVSRPCGIRMIGRVYKKK